MTKLLKGQDVAASLLEKAAEITVHLEVPAQAALVRVGSDPAAKGYQRSAAKILDKVGVVPVVQTFDSLVSFARFKRAIQHLNVDPSISAILLLSPFPQQLPRFQVQDLITPNKDIDGLTRSNLGKTLAPRVDDLVPLTAAAVLELLSFYQIPLRGKKVTVVGASLTVGRPLVNLLLSRHATVSVCDEFTPNLAEFTRNADIVVTAVGHPQLLSAEMVQPGVVVIDVGTNYTDEGHLVGDVDFNGVAAKAAAITPVPGGVGAITTALLAYRTARIAQNNALKR